MRFGCGGDSNFCRVGSREVQTTSVGHKRQVTLRPRMTSKPGIGHSSADQFDDISTKKCFFVWRILLVTWRVLHIN